ncbi:aspartyl protease family protein [Nanoarchaeota archaeon]
MKAVFRFKKEQLENGQYISRPIIPILLEGQYKVQALIDSGSDMTVIPQGLAEAVGLNIQGPEETIYGFKEAINVKESKASFQFSSNRTLFNVNKIPVLIALEDNPEETEITIGINGFFDMFDIRLQKSRNKIHLKKV